MVYNNNVKWVGVYNLLKEGWALMGHMDVLIKQESRSSSLNTKTITAKKIGSTAVTIVDMRRMYRNNREMLMILLERKRANKEAEVVTMV